MNYVISDVHGRLDLFKNMIDKIRFNKEDTLYVLGDIIDRGGGLEVVKYIKQLIDDGYTINCILGNHELSFINQYSNLLDKKTLDDLCVKYAVRKTVKYKKDDSLTGLSRLINSAVIAERKLKDLQYTSEIEKVLINCFKSANLINDTEGYNTLDSVINMDSDKSYELFKFIVDLPLWQQIEVNDKKYILTHGSWGKDTKDYFQREEFFTNPINKDEPLTVIFGHTTTRYIRILTESSIKLPYTIWFDKKYNDKIGIDCGASYPNGRLACLRLEDMKEFYVDNERKTIIDIDDLNYKLCTLKLWQDDINKRAEEINKAI